MKKDKIIFWISTTIIFLTQGLIEFIMLLSGEAVKGIVGLGYPEYFAITLIIFKIVGSIALLISKTPKMIKEIAYIGFGFDFIFAFISILAVSGFTGELVFTIIAMMILVTSYTKYNKIYQ